MTWVVRVLMVASLGVGCAGDGGTTDTTTGTDTDISTDAPTNTDGETTGDTGTPPEPTPFEAFSDADLTDPDIVAALSEASAPNIFLLGYAYLVSADGDGTCPMQTKAGSSVTLTGGCTTKDGVTWSGAANYVIDKSTGVLNAEFEDLGRSEEQDCTASGTVTNRTLFDGTFDLQKGVGPFRMRVSGRTTMVDLDACTAQEADLLIDYEGATIALGGDEIKTKKKKTEPEVASWNGEGTFAHSVYGKANVATYGEITDGDCGSEAESGVTFLRSGTDEATIIYDGAVDCDEESTVEWLLNGAPQGEIEGVDCSHSGSGAGIGAVLAALLLLRRRRD